MPSGWIFDWMQARTASAHALLGEAIAFTHEHDVGLDSDGRHVLLTRLLVATTYLRTLLVALRPSLEELDAGSAAVAMAELGARHRPQLAWRPADGDHVRRLMRCAAGEAAKVRRLMLRLRLGKRTAVVRGLEGVLGQLEEGERLFTEKPPDTLAHA